MKNIEQFSLYTAKIFDVLYENFPVPVSLDEQKIISEYLVFDKHEELKSLKLKKDIAEISKIADQEQLNNKIKEKLPKINNEISKIEKEEYDKKSKTVDNNRYT